MFHHRAKPRFPTLLSLPPQAIRFERNEDFLVLSDDELFEVIRAVARAHGQDLVRLFSANFEDETQAETIGVGLVAKTLLAVASDLARITASGQIESYVDRSSDLGILTNSLVQNRIQEVMPLIHRVVGKFIGELQLLTRQMG